MKWPDLVQPGLGAIVGFALAQFLNFAKLCWDRLNRPRFRFETTDNCRILSHSVQLGGNDYAREETFGFTVRNVGRTTATGVRFQILSIETNTRSLVITG
jgi:hypothetical protein